jgi:APA family basic amino acid/polyamine antiporter
LRLRGRSPLVLVPIANPSTARVMVGVANTLTPPVIGRVLLLSVVPPPENWQKDSLPHQLLDFQAVLSEALSASFSTGLAPETLITVAPQPWDEIIRVSRIRRCESLLLGLSNLNHPTHLKNLETLMNRVDSDVVVLRAPNGWNLSTVKKVLVPIGGRGQQDRLRARLLGSLHHLGIEQVTFLLILPKDTPRDIVKRARKWLFRLAEDELALEAEINVVLNNNVSDEIIRQAADNDLLILGLQRMGPRQKAFGKVVLNIAENTQCGLILINRKG